MCLSTWRMMGEFMIKPEHFKFIRSFDLEEIQEKATEFVQIPLLKDNLQELTRKMIGWGYFCGNPNHPEGEPNLVVEPPKTLKEFKDWVMEVEVRSEVDTITLYNNTLLKFVIDDIN